MKVQEYDLGAQERDILLGMIWSKSALSRIASKWEGEMFAAPASNLIGLWCVEHFRKHELPPKRGIVSYLEAHEGKSHFEQSEKLLRVLLDLPRTVNSGRTIDLAADHFNRVRLSRIKDAIEADLEAGRISKAEEKIATFRRVEMGTGAGIDLFQDDEAIKAALTRDRHESLISYEQEALDGFFRGRLIRGGFIAFMAPEKTGKTTFLVDMAVRGMIQRRRVAYFGIGDETETELHERILVRASKHPFDSHSGSWPCVVNWPTGIKKPARGAENPVADVEHEDREFKGPLSYPRAKEAYAKLIDRKIKSNDSFFRSSSHASVSIGVSGIKSIIGSWQLNGWTPDVVIIDYADNLANPAGKWEERHAINRNWQEMRALNKELHCLLVTATQANRQSYESRRVDRKHVGEDKRKLAHVTGVVGINVAGEEKDKGITRLSWIAARKGRYSSHRELHCAGCWDVGNPCIVSTW